MSYMRGNWYVWGDSERTHLWVRSPEDDITQWVTDCDFAAGVAIPDKILDELAVMRVAELEADGKLEATQRRAVRKWAGNFGCYHLVRKVKNFTKEQYTAWSERRIARWMAKHPPEVVA